MILIFTGGWKPSEFVKHPCDSWSNYIIRRDNIISWRVGHGKRIIHLQSQTSHRMSRKPGSIKQNTSSQIWRLPVASSFSILDRELGKKRWRPRLRVVLSKDTLLRPSLLPQPGIREPMAREYHNFTVSHRLWVVGLNRTSDYKVASSRELPCTEYKGRHRTQITLAPRRVH